MKSILINILKLFKLVYLLKLSFMICGSSNIKKIELRYPEKNEVLYIKDNYVVKKKKYLHNNML